METSSISCIPYGGGPKPLLGDQGHDAMVKNLREIAKTHPKPSATLVISAHWEAERPTVNIRNAHHLLYDYSGFPPKAYDFQYSVQGAPGLAKKIFEKLSEAGLDPAQERARGLDHGVFVPLILMYPDGEIPVVELSLVRGLDPKLHIEIGKAISDLDWPDLLVIGSGMSFHNPGALASPPPGASVMNQQFQDWLRSTLVEPSHTFEDRAEAPAARFCHPRAEHLFPLHVCFGMTVGKKEPAKIQLQTDVMGTSVICLKWVKL